MFGVLIILSESGLRNFRMLLRQCYVHASDIKCFLIYSRGREKCYVSCKQKDIKTMQCFIRLEETFTIPKRGTLVVKLAVID